VGGSSLVSEARITGVRCLCIWSGVRFYSNALPRQAWPQKKKTEHCANCSWMLLKALKWFVGVTRRCIGKTLFSFLLRYFGAKLRRPETVHSFVRITNFCVVEIGSAPKDSPAVTVIVTVIYIAQCAPYWRPTAHHKTIPVFRQTARIVWGHAFLSNKNNV